GCPVEIDIPAFIANIAEGNFKDAAAKIAETSLLPAICGRVCPQETQCEGRCVLGKKGDAVSIGKLERFVADYARENHININTNITKNTHRIAVIGSGPAGLTCAADLARMGYQVTVFEALHRAGGVLTYGIPEFRLPKQAIVEPEIEKLKSLGVDIHTNVVIGKTYSIQSLLEKEGFEAIFIGVGAGLPKFMNIKGENLNGVVSANEFLTRNNLMKAYNPEYLTPNYVGKNIAVIGGGNVAMDAARTALRLGAKVSVFYRRSENELPARHEEVCHAKEEGVEFHFLTTPVELIGENDWVKTIKFRKMQLGEPDASGRRSPVEIEGSDYTLDKDMVIMAIGTSPNPLIGQTTEGLIINKKGCIEIDEHGQTSKQGIFAGGDATSGAATVILAMGAGRTAAKAIDNYIKNK
ncbi:MAG: NADPH-dependent glutamate synthase, partial [Bacteroidales bacterium]|nr:NADPH-dependent glutamate synthase [Bacteroidales bacterium]